MNLYKREEYLKKIRGFYHDTDIIKVPNCVHVRITNSYQQK